MREKERKRICATEYTCSECCMRLIRSLVAVELLVYGVRTILSSAFENWVLSKEAQLWIQLFLVGTILVNELIPLLGRRYMVKLRVLCEMLLLGWLGWRTWRIRETLQISVHAWFDDYLPYWNAYHNTDYYPYHEGGKLEFALAFAILSIMLCTLILRYVCERRIFLLLPNIAAVGVALLVNVRPDAKSLLVSFAGVLVLYSGGWEAGKTQIRSRIGRQKPVTKKMGWQMAAIGATVAIACGIVLVTPVCFKSEVVRISDYGPKFLDFQLQAEDWLMSIAGIASKPSYDKNKAILGNDKPTYHDDMIVTIRSNQLPQENLYLKSFCSSTYKNGTWQPLDDSFITEADEQGFDSTDLAKNLQQMTYEKMNQDIISGWMENNYGMKEADMQFTYENPKNHAALLPYFWNPSSCDANVWMDKDAVWRKGKESSISFKQWMFSWQDLLRSEEIYADTGDEAYEESEAWYENYVSEHDKNSTAEVPMVKNYADRVARALQENALLSDDESKNICDRVKEMWFHQYISYRSYAWTNANGTTQCYANDLARSAVTQEVRNQLFSDTEYNLYLDSLPAGTDPVEYFLGTGKEGYCMHYASAATLILQELGVPARYASGFVVKQGLFAREDGKTITKQDFFEKDRNQYVATVKDYYAHAWVEIYMDGIGWVPYEMTPGYTASDDAVPTDGKKDEELKQRHEEHKKEVESQTESEQPSEATESSQQETTQQNTQETQNTETPSTQINPPTDTNQRNGLIKIILIVFWIVFVLGLLLYGSYRFVVSYRKRLLQELQARRNRNAVKRINRRIYRGLMKGRSMNTAKISRSGKFDIYMRPLTDAEYAEKLMKTYVSIAESDWMRYMEIVKKCAFSHEVITDEEAAFCYRIYKNRRK